MNTSNSNGDYSYYFFGQLILIIGCFGITIFILFFSIQTTIRAGIGGVVLGLFCGYLIGAGHAIMVNFKKPNDTAESIQPAEKMQ